MELEKGDGFRITTTEEKAKVPKIHKDNEQEGSHQIGEIIPMCWRQIRNQVRSDGRKGAGDPGNRSATASLKHYRREKFWLTQ